MACRQRNILHRGEKIRETNGPAHENYKRQRDTPGILTYSGDESRDGKYDKAVANHAAETPKQENEPKCN